MENPGNAGNVGNASFELQNVGLLEDVALH
jgi:hypothetical protein